MPVYRQTMEVIYPPRIPANRALWLVLTTWRMKRREFRSQRVLASDRRQLDESQIVLSEFVLPAAPATPAAAPYATFGNGFSLDATALPEVARSGDTLTIRFSWRSERDSREDFVQFLHLGHSESGEWWVYDQRPLGCALANAAVV